MTDHNTMLHYRRTATESWCGVPYRPPEAIVWLRYPICPRCKGLLEHARIQKNNRERLAAALAEERCE